VKIRRVFAHIAFAFLLLISQQLGMTHAISHISSEIGAGASQKKQLPAELQCEQCLAFASLGSALTGDPPSVAQQFLPSAEPLAASQLEPLPSSPRPFDSRGPPSLI
jgi:hypothetical protein